MLLRIATRRSRSPWLLYQVGRSSRRQSVASRRDTASVGAGSPCWRRSSAVCCEKGGGQRHALHRIVCYGVRFSGILLIPGSRGTFALARARTRSRPARFARVKSAQKARARPPLVRFEVPPPERTRVAGVVEPKYVTQRGLATSPHLCSVGMERGGERETKRQKGGKGRLEDSCFHDTSAS